MDAELAAREAAAQIASASERVSVEFGGQSRDAVDASGAFAAGSAGAPASGSRSGPNAHVRTRPHVNGVGVPASAGSANSAAASAAARHAVSLNEYKRRLQQSASTSPLPPDQQIAAAEHPARPNGALAIICVHIVDSIAQSSIVRILYTVHYKVYTKYDQIQSIVYVVFPNTNTVLYSSIFPKISTIAI